MTKRFLLDNSQHDRVSGNISCFLPLERAWSQTDIVSSNSGNYYHYVDPINLWLTQR